MQLSEWFVSLSVAPHERSVFDVSDAESLWLLITEWAERRNLGIGGSYRLEGEAFLYEYGVCATQEDQLIDGHELQDLLDLISAHVAGRGVLSGGFRPFTEDESDPSRLDRLIEIVRRSIN